MFEKLLPGIPLNEAAAYFIELKGFDKRADATSVGSSTYAPPDETGELEGAFAVPVERVLEHLAKMVQNELKTNYAYMVYANSLRDFAHHSIAEEFESHADDETEHADWLLRRMGVLGGPIHVPDIPAPPAATEAEDIIQTMIRMEQEGIQNWRILRQMVGDENPTKFKIEEYLTQEQEHLDELWQLMPHTANPQILSQRAGMPMSEMPQAPPSAPDVNPAPLTGPETSKMAAAIRRMKTASDKLKTSEMPGGLPPTAMGQQSMQPAPMPLSGVAAGQLPKMAEAELYQKFSYALHKLAKEDSEQVEAGRARALANLASNFEAAKHTRGTMGGDLAGRAAGASLGGISGALAGRLAGHSPALSLALAGGGAAMGQHLGGKAGRMLGRAHDAKKFHEKYGSAQSLFKQALDEMTGGAPVINDDGMQQDPSMQPPVSPLADPEVAAYMQQEQAGRAAELENESAFYKQRFAEASQQVQASQAQMQQLQQQADQSGQQQQATMAQAQQIQQAALSNAQAAHESATFAMQQSLQAQQQSIQQAQLAVGMRDSVHAMRQGLMQMVQQQLPPATPAEAGAMQADQAAAQQGGMNPQDNTQQPQPEQSQAGQPAAAPDAGTPMQSATPGDGSGAGNSPSAGAGAEPLMAGATPQAQAGQQAEQPKTASDKLIGAIMGGALGGGVGYASSRMSNDPLREKVHKLEERESSGKGSFLTGLNLAQAKARLALGEFDERHPGATTLLGIGSGALAGASHAPTIREISQTIGRFGA